MIQSLLFVKKHYLLIGIAACVFSILSACGSTSSEACYGDLEFDQMVRRADGEQYSLTADPVLIIYNGEYSESCRRMFYKESGEYTFELTITSNPSPAIVRQIRLTEHRLLLTPSSHPLTLETGSLKYVRPIVYGRREDRLLLLPWTPTPRNLSIQITYPIEPTLEFLPRSVSYEFQWK
jgi:hypothetical protein